MSPLELLAQLARYGNTSFWLVNSAAHNLYALSGAIYCGEVRRGRIYDYTAHSSSTSAILRLRMVISRKRPAIRAMGRCVDQGHLTAHDFPEYGVSVSLDHHSDGSSQKAGEQVVVNG